MPYTYEPPGWQTYTMEYSRPHRELEPPEREIAVVDGALGVLVGAGILPHADYDLAAFLSHRAAVREKFDIPWTAITPRMQRLLYAINAIAQPQVMVAVGIFCGNTFISNAGAAVGPGAVYRAKRLVGIEIRPDEAARARRNVEALGNDGRAEIVAGDGLPWLEKYDGAIDLLYLDADGAGGRGKSIYLDMLQTAWPALRPGSLVIAHNSVNCAAQLADTWRSCAIRPICAPAPICLWMARGLRCRPCDGGRRTTDDGLACARLGNTISVCPTPRGSCKSFCAIPRMTSRPCASCTGG